jgi:hypothetical protein
MGYALFGTSTLLGLILKKSKLVSLLLIGSMITLFAFNTLNSDSAAYELQYSNPSFYTVQTFSAGYVYLTVAFASLGFDYTGFRLITGLICYAVLYLVVKRYTRSISFVLSTCMLVPFLFQIVQSRFMIASTIAIAGIPLLIECRSLWKIPGFVGVVSLACTIHPGAALFLLLLLGLFNRKRCIIISTTLSIAIIFIVLSGQISAFSWLLGAEKSIYFEGSLAFGYLSRTLVYCAVILLIGLVRVDYRVAHSGPIDSTKIPVSEKFSSAAGEDQMQLHFEIRQAEFVEYVHNAVFALMPLAAMLIVSGEFARVLFNLTFMFSTYISITCFDCAVETRVSGRPKDRYNALLYSTVYIILIIMIAILIYSARIDDVVSVELLNNSLLSNGSIQL